MRSMDYRGVGIASVWIVCGSIIALLNLQTGIEFFGVLTLLAIAMVMSGVILHYGRDYGEAKVEGLGVELSELKKTIMDMNAKIERLNRILEE